MHYSADKLLVKQLLKAISKLASLAQRARQITYVHNIQPTKPFLERRRVALRGEG